MRFKEEDLRKMTATPAAERGMVAKAPAVAGEKLIGAPPVLTSMQRLQALGRMKSGDMNKTEQRFLDDWITPRILARDLKWWKFEAITLKLAPDCRLTVDFFVMRSTGELQAYDVKGSSAIISDDSAVKMRIAADMFPWPFFYAFPIAQKLGGGWNVKPV